MDNNKKNAIYMVTYKDDARRKHMTFVKGFSAVKFLEDRFGTVDVQNIKDYDNTTLFKEFY